MTKHIQKLLELYKHDPVACKFILENKEAFGKTQLNAPHFNIPQKKDTEWMKYIHILNPGKYRNLLYDVAAGMKNEQIAKKYKYKNSAYAAEYICKAKKVLSDKIKNITGFGKVKYADINVNKPIARRQLRWQGMVCDIYLVKVPANRVYVAKVKEWDQLITEINLNKADFINSIKPNTINTELVDMEVLTKEVCKYRWVNTAGFPLTKIIENWITPLLLDNGYSIDLDLFLPKENPL